MSVRYPTPHSLFLTSKIKLDGIPSKTKWNICGCFLVHSNFEGTFYKKLQNIATNPFISCCFKSVFTSADIIFYNFSELDLKLYKKTLSQSSLFNRFKCPPPTPPPTPNHHLKDLNLLSMTKVFRWCSLSHQQLTFIPINEQLAVIS